MYPSVLQIVSEMLETISEEMSEPTGEAESSLTKADSFAEDQSSPDTSVGLPSDHERCIQVRFMQTDLCTVAMRCIWPAEDAGVAA